MYLSYLSNLSIQLSSSLSIYLCQSLPSSVSIFSLALYIYIYIYISLSLSLSVSFLVLYYSHSLPLYLSLSLSISLYISRYLSLSLSIALLLYLSLARSLSLSLSLFLSFSFSSFLLSLSPSRSPSPSFSLSLSLSLSVTIYESFYLSFYLEGSSYARPASKAEVDKSKRKHFCKTSSKREVLSPKAKKFCEAFSIFELATSKTKQFCETSFKTGTLSAELTASCSCVLRFLCPICLKYRACHEKVKVLHLPRKMTFANLKIGRSEVQPLWNPGNQRPDLLTVLTSLVNVPPLTFSQEACHRATATRPPGFVHFWQGTQSIAPATKHEDPTSESALNMWCSWHFVFGMCFAPQHFQECSVLTSKFSSRHSRVRFMIPHPTR